jgi:glycine hydroxymethyltransferase
MHSIYNTDKIRSSPEKMATDHQFAGRDGIAQDCRDIYEQWSKAIGAKDLTMRLLSGLHAHATFFMAATTVGQTVLLLPVEAGGHMSTKSILERLGLRVVEIKPDFSNCSINVQGTLDSIKNSKPDFMFIDRSEGLVYEDFSEIVNAVDCPTLFDGSQYLSNILAGDHLSPFAMGFDYFMATLHKNFPGPQRAMLATRDITPAWKNILSGISSFVSNMHVSGIYSAGLTLTRDTWLKEYSRSMLINTLSLENNLHQEGVSVIQRPSSLPPTHHIWIRAKSKQHAFKAFQDLEACGILVNYRKLPYKLGHGLRLGVNAATRIGLVETDTRQLASIISQILEYGAGSSQIKMAKQFIDQLWGRTVGM